MTETTFHVRYAETDALFATGYTKYICINRQGQVTKIPEHWRQFMANPK